MKYLFTFGYESVVQREYKAKGILKDVTNPNRHFVIFLPTPTTDGLRIPRGELQTGLGIPVLGPTGKTA